MQSEFIRWAHQFAEVLKKYPTHAISTKIAAYLAQAVQKITTSLSESRPTKPTDWKRAPRINTCKCATCQYLRQFCDSPTEHVFVLPQDKNTQAHLLGKIPRFGGFKLENSKPALNQPPVLYKVNEEYDKELKMWTDQRSRIQQKMKQIRDCYPVDQLKEAYDAFVRLTGPLSDNVTPRPQQSTSLQPTPASVQNARGVSPVAGIKRKVADVVDLTEDASD
jgi:hypothetical protein